VFYLATTEAALARHAAFVPLAAAHGIDSTMLSAAEVAAMMPAAARRWLGGLWTPSDLRAEPWVAVPALARLAAARGVRVVEHCAVRALDVAAGRVTGMVTEQGRIAAPAVVLPGGAWSGLMLGRHGVGLPQLLVRATVARTETLPEVFGGAASDGRIAFRRRADGGYTLAAGGAAELFLGPPAFKNAARYRPVLRRNPFAIRPSGRRLRATRTPGQPRGHGPRTGRRPSRRCACSILRPRGGDWRRSGRNSARPSRRSVPRC
jgi:glycine/D-amino acid oxidase-like deaminating enzyme